MKLRHKILPRPIVQKQEASFVTYVRTLMFQRYRFKENVGLNPVHIELNEIAERFYPWPQYRVKEELGWLVKCDEIEITQSLTEKGNKIYFYKALKSGPVNLDMIPIRGRDLDDLTEKIVEFLGRVTLSQNPSNQIYFSGFLTAKRMKREYIRPFFIVDDFCGRIHTPVTSLPGEYRKHILIDGQETISLDIATMQPQILGKLLKDNIGPNEFSGWLDQGDDVYAMLQEKAGLESREQGKKRFFEILYSKSNDALALLFGNANWITWVNEYKTKEMPENPHTKEKPHSNLAWLLQSEEVKIMRRVWTKLAELHIPFVTVHDEIIVKKREAKETESVMHDVLSKVFTSYKINSSLPITAEPHNSIPDELRKRITDHFLSFKLPYSLNDPGDIESLVSGFKFETGIEITGDSYKVAVLNHKDYNNN